MATISHHGVKGMHWGVRNATNVAGAAKTVSEVTNLIPHKTQTVFNQKVKEAGGLHRVSDKDLLSMLNRLNMEKQYRKMMSEDSERRAKGLKAAGKILLTIGKFALPLIIGGAVVKTGPADILRVPSTVLQKSLGK